MQTYVNRVGKGAVTQSLRFSFINLFIKEILQRNGDDDSGSESNVKIIMNRSWTSIAQHTFCPCEWCDLIDGEVEKCRLNSGDGVWRISPAARNAKTRTLHIWYRLQIRPQYLLQSFQCVFLFVTADPIPLFPYVICVHWTLWTENMKRFRTTESVMKLCPKRRCSHVLPKNVSSAVRTPAYQKLRARTPHRCAMQLHSQRNKNKKQNGVKENRS